MNDPKLRLYKRSGGEIHIMLDFDGMSASIYNVSKNEKYGLLPDEIKRLPDNFAEWTDHGSFIRLTRPLRYPRANEPSYKIQVPGEPKLYFAIQDNGIEAQCYSNKKQEIGLYVCHGNPFGKKFKNAWRAKLLNLSWDQKRDTKSYIERRGFHTDWANWTNSGQWAGLK